jgi:hypothetical protein
MLRKALGRTPSARPTAEAWRSYFANLVGDAADVSTGVHRPLSPSWSAAFTTLKAEIDKGFQQLMADGFAVHRPFVIFISGGPPADVAPWSSAYSALIESAWAPHLIPINVSGSPPLPPIAHLIADQSGLGTAENLVTVVRDYIAPIVAQGGNFFGPSSDGFIAPVVAQGSDAFDDGDFV